MSLITSITTKTQCLIKSGAIGALNVSEVVKIQHIFILIIDFN